MIFIEKGEIMNDIEQKEMRMLDKLGNREFLSYLINKSYKPTDYISISLFKRLLNISIGDIEKDLEVLKETKVVTYNDDDTNYTKATQY